MDAREKRAREIQREIAKVLLEDWDPLGIRDVGPADEYDGYVASVYRLLTSSPTANRVADHLYRMEVEPMGLRTGTVGPDHLLPVAEKLLAIDVDLDKA